MSSKFSKQWSLFVALAGVFWASEPAIAEVDDVRRDASVAAIERVTPSVVNISTETVISVPDPVEDLFRQFFDPYYRERPNALKSLGSGIIIDDAGYILTNEHVVRRANRITVTLWDGREFQAERVVATPQNDVAVLKLVAPETERFEPVRMAGPDDLILGETVIALGNPFGLGASVSRGILSSKPRRKPVDHEPLGVADWIQTDAAINPGNSGGPLINLKGELIGINVAIFRDAQGIGFAIPVRRISDALSEIFTPELLRSLWFGARIRPNDGNFLVARVEEGSPSERAGLKEGDQINAINGVSPKNIIELNQELISSGEDRDIHLLVERNGTAKELTVRLLPESEVFNGELIRRRTGASVQKLTPDLAEALGMRVAAGLLVAGVEEGSPAAMAGLAEGHVITGISGYEVNEIEHAAKIIYGKQKGESVELNLMVQRTRGPFVQIYRASTALALR